MKIPGGRQHEALPGAPPPAPPSGGLPPEHLPQYAAAVYI